MRLFEAMAEAPNSSEQQYLVLAEYELLYDWLCSSSDKIYREAVLLRGNAGMGTFTAQIGRNVTYSTLAGLSIFRSYLLYRRLLDGKPTAFLARGGQLFLFHEHGVAFYSLAQSSSPPLAWCKIGVWIIVDFDGPAGYSEELSLAIGGGKLVYPASHAGYHLWRRWVNKLHRRGTAEWMRPWSIADLQYRYNADFWVLIRRSCRPAMRSVVYCIASNRATSSSISGTSDQSLEMSSAIKLHTKAALRR